MRPDGLGSHFVVRLHASQGLLFLNSRTPELTQEHQSFSRLHFKFYRVLLDTRVTNSSNRESKSLRMGDWFVFL